MRFRPQRCWLIVLLAFAIPLFFAGFTGHAWEDYFITLRSSRNLVDGHGLVFNPGERVHTFTSPLGVLIPALCTWLAGGKSELAALWLFRVLNAGFLAGAAALVWRRTGTLAIGSLGRGVFFGVVLTDAKLTDFATNGMETAMLVFFVLLLWSELERPEGPRSIGCGVGCAGLLWTRPDAFILAAAMILPHWLLRARVEPGNRVAWRTVLMGLLIGGALYLPWFTWAWWYYGSPVPHTIIAKSQVTPAFHLRDLLLIPWRTLTGESLLMDLFLPTYWFHGGWPALLRYVAYPLTIIAAFGWLIPVLPLAARRVSLSVFIGMFYLCAIILFPWYSPPWTVLAALAVAFTMDHVASRANPTGRRWIASSVRMAAVVVVVVQAGVLIATAWQMRIQQRLVENGVRREIGLWLHENASATDTVFLEPLGYIGYYSRLKTYDYPGLSSPEVVASIRAGSRRLTEVIDRLSPTWLVVRPFEVADRNRAENAAWQAYDLVRSWDARPQLDAVRILPGRPWVEHDARFQVYRRNTDRFDGARSVSGKTEARPADKPLPTR